MNDSDTDENWIDVDEVRDRYNLTPSQLKNKIELQIFPPPITVNGKKRWLADTLRRHDQELAKRAHQNVIDGWLCMRHVMERYGKSKRTIEYWVQKGTFPPPIKQGAQRLWSTDSLDDYDKNGFSLKPKRRSKK